MQDRNPQLHPSQDDSWINIKTHLLKWLFCHLLNMCILIGEGCILRHTSTRHKRISFAQRCYYCLKYIMSPSRATKCHPLCLQAWIEALGNHTENHQLENWTKFKQMQSNIYECKAIVVTYRCICIKNHNTKFSSASMKSSMDLESFFHAPL